MPKKVVVPGTWGKCTCQGCAWNIGDEVWQCCYLSKPISETGFSWLYCPWCGDLCGEGGHIRPNLRRLVEADVLEFADELLSHELDWRTEVDFRDYLARLRGLLAVGCPTCGGTGYIQQEGMKDFESGSVIDDIFTQYELPCPDCQPDGREAEDNEGRG